MERLIEYNCKRPVIRKLNLHGDSRNSRNLDASALSGMCSRYTTVWPLLVLRVGMGGGSGGRYVWDGMRREDAKDRAGIFIMRKPNRPNLRRMASKRLFGLNPSECVCVCVFRSF